MSRLSQINCALVVNKKLTALVGAGMRKKMNMTESRQSINRFFQRFFPRFFQKLFRRLFQRVKRETMP